MRMGFSIFILAVGAILAFAVSATVAGLDIHVVGWVLMAAGILGLVLNTMVFGPRRRTLVRTREVVAGTPAADGRPLPQETLVERDFRDDRG